MLALLPIVALAICYILLCLESKHNTRSGSSR